MILGMNIIRIIITFLEEQDFNNRPMSQNFNCNHLIYIMKYVSTNSQLSTSNHDK